jgi:hypothetical protein
MFNNKEFKDISLLVDKKDFEPYNYIWFVNNRYLVSSNHYQLMILDTIYSLSIKDIAKINYKNADARYFDKDMQEVVCREKAPDIAAIVEQFIDAKNEYAIENWTDIKDIALLNKYTGKDYYIVSETICLFNKVKTLKDFDKVYVPKGDGLVMLVGKKAIFLTTLAERS